MKIIFKVLKALFFGFGGALVGIILGGIFTAGVGHLFLECLVQHWGYNGI